ncbi:hypothetical protein GCM10007874_68880 [Labrys miyagiensis]|uniref:Sulfatase n=1 Tax=Labrys miyagiensis TaxID=346912 RepID=A0ABQ6CU38_9HYPH|nr:hypothetical protein GCM10007874_68880 [Labrys miyagiensis]
MNFLKRSAFGLFASAGILIGLPGSAQQAKPNILVIMADDIGYWNISAYNRGMIGYRTPNIDRLIEHAFLLVPDQAIVAEHLQSFRDFPPRQRPGSFSIEQTMEMLRAPPSGN